jgi:hypothetical protein
MNSQTFGKATRVLMLFLTLPFLPIGCASKRSEVATTFGYERSLKVNAGPYQLHYGKSGADELLLLSEGKRNILSRITGQGTDVYLDGRQFIHFDRSPDGSLTNIQMHLMDAHGKETTTLVDRDADGQWDVKFDEVTGEHFVWKDGHWIPH